MPTSTPLAQQVLAQRKAALSPASVTQLSSQLLAQSVPFNSVTTAQVLSKLEQLIKQQRYVAGPLLIPLPALPSSVRGRWAEAEFRYVGTINVVGTQFGDVHELLFEFMHII